MVNTRPFVVDYFFLQDNREMDSDDFQESEASDDSNLTNAVSFACH